MVSKKSPEGLDMYKGTKLTLSSDVDQDIDVWFSWKMYHLQV